MDTVAEILNEVIGWKSNKGYETKKKIENTIFISNKNNIKGLEFPFIICVSTDPINSDLILRNALYMIITRSFLKTYFLFSDKNTDEFKNSLKLGLKNINEGKIKVEIPTEEEQKKIRNNIKMLQESSKKSLDQKIDDEIKKLDLKKQDIKKLKELLYVKIDNDNNIFDEERIKELIEKCCEILKM